MKISDLIKYEENFGKGDFKIEKVPSRLQPTHETTVKIDKEIRVQVSDNHQISRRSIAITQNRDGRGM